MSDQIKDQIKEQIFHVRLNNQLSDSILNYFTMAIGLFFYGCFNADIVYKNNTVSLFYELIFIAGIAQMLLTIFDWYKGRSLNLLSSFLFGLLFISWYYKYYKILVNNMDYSDKTYEGVFYILFFAISITMLISLKNKGIIYSINYLALIVAFIFMIVDKYEDKNWIKKTFGYAFIVSGGLFWITGTLRIINGQFLNKSFFLFREN